MHLDHQFAVLVNEHLEVQLEVELRVVARQQVDDGLLLHDHRLLLARTHRGQDVEVAFVLVVVSQVLHNAVDLRLLHLVEDLHVVGLDEREHCFGLEQHDFLARLLLLLVVLVLLDEQLRVDVAEEEVHPLRHVLLVLVVVLHREPDQALHLVQAFEEGLLQVAVELLELFHGVVQQVHEGLHDEEVLEDPLVAEVGNFLQGLGVFEAVRVLDVEDELQQVVHSLVELFDQLAVSEDDVLFQFVSQFADHSADDRDCLLHALDFVDLLDVDLFDGVRVFVVGELFEAQRHLDFAEVDRLVALVLLEVCVVALDALVGLFVLSRDVDLVLAFLEVGQECEDLELLLKLHVVVVKLVLDLHVVVVVDHRAFGLVLADEGDRGAQHGLVYVLRH